MRSISSWIVFRIVVQRCDASNTSVFIPSSSIWSFPRKKRLLKAFISWTIGAFTVGFLRIVHAIVDVSLQAGTSLPNICVSNATTTTFPRRVAVVRTIIKWIVHVFLRSFVSNLAAPMCTCCCCCCYLEFFSLCVSLRNSEGGNDSRKRSSLFLSLPPSLFFYSDLNKAMNIADKTSDERIHLFGHFSNGQLVRIPPESDLVGYILNCRESR